jgi:hypothetical protein
VVTLTPLASGVINVTSTHNSRLRVAH